MVWPQLQDHLWLQRAHQLEEKIDYHFQDRAWLAQACTHSTFIYEHHGKHFESNERLEFLGDSILGLTAAHLLFQALPKAPEGQLSLLRTRLVCEPTLARIAQDLDLGALLYLGRGENASGGCKKSSNLSNAVEALYGAVFCDSSLEEALQVVQKSLQYYVEEALKGGLVYDYKSQLLEKIQEKYSTEDVEFRLIQREGPAHNPLFTMGIYLKNHCLAVAQGHSKKEALQIAAKEALEKMGSDLCI